MKQSVGHGAGPLKVVLDTNVLLSALLFEGVTNRLVDLWQRDKIRIFVIRPILEEYIRALSYPKFDLTEKEIKAILEEEILPYVKTIPTFSYAGVPFIKDPDDRKFLACTKAGKADYLLTGDKVLLSLKHFRTTVILKPGDFLRIVFP
jgi:putative PIN family toxin of toxin-antitoxin system